MKYKIIFTANAGFILEACGKRILIDALHNTPSNEWSALDSAKTEKLISYLDQNKPDVIYFTHVHPDHYSGALTQFAAERYPNCRLIMPKKENSNNFSCGDVRLEWTELPHMRVNGKNAGTNFCLTIYCKDKTKPFAESKVFVSGDVDITDPLTLRHIEGLAPDLAMINFPWLTIHAGREALVALDPMKTVLIHLPYHENDRFGYIKATADAAEKFMPWAISLTDFFQTVEITV